MTLNPTLRRPAAALLLLFALLLPAQTAPGHATMMTGAWPSETGIVANCWFDREAGKRVSNVDDDSVRTLGGPDEDGPSSPRRPADKFFGARWERLLPAAEYERRAGRDDAPWEKGADNKSYVFPHVIDGGLKAPGRYLDASTPADIAPTLARILNVAPAASAAGRVLAEAFK